MLTRKTHQANLRESMTCRKKAFKVMPMIISVARLKGMHESKGRGA